MSKDKKHRLDGILRMGKNSEIANTNFRFLNYHLGHIGLEMVTDTNVSLDFSNYLNR